MNTIGLHVPSGLFWEGMINRYRESVVHQLITYFSERYFSVSFHRYEHIPLGPSANGSAQMIILAAMIALILASVVISVTRAREGRLVRRLLKEECFSPECAKTLYELGEFQSTFVRRALSRGGTLRKCVYCDFGAFAKEVPLDDGTSQEKLSEEETELRRHDRNRLNGERKLDFTTARFYIPAPLKYRAEVRYERQGRVWLGILLTVVFSLVGAALVCRFLPDFVQLLDNLLILSAPQ